MVFIKPSSLTTIHSRAFQHQTQFSPGGVKWEISGKSYCQLDADTKRPIWDFVDIGREPNWQFRNLSNIRNPPEDQIREYSVVIIYISIKQYIKTLHHASSSSK